MEGVQQQITGIHYRTGNHYDDTLYEHREGERDGIRVALFLPGTFNRGQLIAATEDPGFLAAAVRNALNATMPGCTCPVICRQCGAAPIGNPENTSPGCESCTEHRVECEGQAREKIIDLAGELESVAVTYGAACERGGKVGAELAERHNNRLVELRRAIAEGLGGEWLG